MWVHPNVSLLEIKMAAPSEKLENCEVCAGDKAKYTCPKCEVRTCGVTCVNIHKKELECDGIRDRTKFVPLNNFTDLDLLSDYRLLEEVGRSVDKLQRDESKKFTRENQLPVHLYKLRQAASRSRVKLEYMPQNFSRHKENTTYFNWKSNELFWRIEWIFPQAENIKWITKRALESKRLSELLETILDPLNSTNDIQEDDPQKIQKLHDKLQYYRATGLTGIKVLLKAEKVKRSDSRFHELDLTLSLYENLVDKVIIEFPSIYVVLKDHSNMYEIIDTDDEEEIVDTPSKSTHRRKRGLRKDHDIKNGKNRDKAPVNFFFNNNSTDSEEESINDRSRGESSHSQLNIPQQNTAESMEY